MTVFGLRPKLSPESEESLCKKLCAISVAFPYSPAAITGILAVAVAHPLNDPMQTQILVSETQYNQRFDRMNNKKIGLPSGLGQYAERGHATA